MIVKIKALLASFVHALVSAIKPLLQFSKKKKRSIFFHNTRIGPSSALQSSFFFYFVSCKQIGIIIQRHLMQILGRMQLFNQVVKHHIYQCHFNYDVFRPTNLHKYNQFERRSFLSINSVIASETPYLNRSKNSFNVSLATLYNRSMYQQLNH